MRLAWLWGAVCTACIACAACAACAAHAAQPLTTYEVVQLGDAAASYFEQQYAEPQAAVADALRLLRSLIGTADARQADEGAPPKLPNWLEALSGRIESMGVPGASAFQHTLRRWIQRHAVSLTHDAGGSYAGPVRYVLATVLDYILKSPKKKVRAPHTYYDTPPHALWPDWDFDARKAHNATLLLDAYPVINGWEQAMWGPFVGPLHDGSTPAVSAIVHNFSTAYTKSALMDAVRGAPQPHRLPTPDAALQDIRTHAVQLLEWVAYTPAVGATAEDMLRAAFSNVNQTQSAQTDALWILGEHFLWGTHGARPNMTRAWDAFARLARTGNATAHARLGYMASSPFLARVYGTHASDADAMLHYTVAAQEADWLASNALAYRQLYGIGTTMNCSESLVWFDYLARRAHDTFSQGPPGGRTLPYSKIRLSDRMRLTGPSSQLASGQHFKAFFSLSPISYYMMLTAMERRPDVLLDHAAIDELMEQYSFLAHEEPLKRFKYALSQYFGSIVGYRNALGALRPNPEEAARHALALASQAWPIPIVLRHIDDELSPHGTRGPLLRYVPLTPHEAYAAKKAAVLLGVQYLRGEGVPQDFKRAKVWLTRAASEGDPMGMAYLAMMYDQGLGGMKVDATRAWEFYRGSYVNSSLSLLGMAKRHIQAGHPQQALPLLTNAVDSFGQARGLAFTGAAFETVYWHSGLEADQMYKAPEGGNCRAVATKFQALVHRGDWADPVYHRGEAALDRGDVATALHAWSMAAEAGMAEAQDNIAQMLDQFTSWRHTPEARPYDDLALEYWAQSAAQGSALAQTKVCDYILHGLAPGTMAQAARCYRSQIDGTNDLLNKWRLARLYENGASGFARDFPLAKRLYDFINLHNNVLNPTVTWTLLRLHVKAFGAMLRGDITAQRLFTAYLPSMPPLPRLPISSDALFDLVLFATGLCALCILALIRRHMHRRMDQTQRAYEHARAPT